MDVPCVYYWLSTFLSPTCLCVAWTSFVFFLFLLRRPLWEDRRHYVHIPGDNGHHASHRGDLLGHGHGLWPDLAPTSLLRPHKGDTQVIQENYWSVVIVEAALGLISIKSQSLPQVTYFDYGIHINLNISVDLISKLMRQHAASCCLFFQPLSLDCLFLGFFSF